VNPVSKLRRIYLSLPFALVLGCGSSTAPGQPVATSPAPDANAAASAGPADGPAALRDRVFVSVKVTEGGAPSEVIGDTVLRLHLRDGNFGASAACNSMDGRYQITDGVFSASGGHTEMGCDAPRHAQDDWYFGFLSSKPSIDIDGDRITLRRDGKQIEFLDQEVATPDVPLAGPQWKVGSVEDAATAMRANWSQPATFTFDASGGVKVFTGCNEGSGKYEVVGAEVTFSGFTVTERACTDKDLAELEAAVLRVVQSEKALSWKITVDRLSLQGEEFGLGLSK